ncbi:juvenile hormone esterase-like [Calliphora vicina]|uniref:juvenile hormone esterase-like n=1 Tax=Calliphora vicina TaxID=7373 RepID=UPI00325C2481
MWLKLKIILLICVILVKSNEELKVCLNNLGCIMGTEKPGYNGGDFLAFLGVPYAKPPIGDLRFRNPEPIESWQGVLSAVEAKPDCKQRNYLIHHWPIVGDEDCLYMNIYRPKGVIEKPLPVIFYIYGGGFFSGSSNPAVIGPEYFMDTAEVLVVVITYRLGPFGFLSSGCGEMPGNFGLKDQLLALKWVNEHIAAFGGDPNEITLFGHSAGASAAHFHMINPKTKDLFKQAILSSGNVLAPYVGIVDKPLEQMHTIAHALGIDAELTQNTKDLVDKLRTLDADTILHAGDSLKFWFNHILFNFGPVIEDATETNSYLIEHPYETIRHGNYDLKPWFTGLVSYKGEGAPISLNIYDNLTLRAELNENFDEKMMKLLDIKSEEKFNGFIEEYMEGVHELNTNTGDGFLELFSDYYFYYPVYNTLKHYFDYADVTKGPVYIYKFSYHGPHTYVPVYTGGSTNRYDVVHFDDLLYQFRQSALFPDFEKESIDAKLSKEFVDILLGFVKTGKPLHYDDVGSCTMEQFITSGPKGMCNYLEFANSDDGYKRVVNKSFHVDRMKLWDEVMKY